MPPTDSIAAPPRESAPADRAPARGRLLDLDRCKGLAILLVVVGHLIARGTPEGYEGYGLLKKAIYDFHMPVFLYLSGYVFFHLGNQIREKEAYRRLVASRAVRLLIPFLAVGILIVLAKYAAQFVVSVDQPPGSLAGGLANLFFDTRTSPALSIWYVWVLFFYSILTPLLWRLMGPVLFWLIPLLLLAGLAPVTDDLYADRIVRFSGFFLIGGAAALAGERWLDLLDRGRWLWLSLFLASFVLIALDVDWRVRLIVTGALAIPAIHGLMRLPALKDEGVLLFFARSAFVIYLFNTLFIGAAKGVIGKVAPFEGWGVAASLPVLFLAGAFGPILLREVILARIPRLYDLTR